MNELKTGFALQNGKYRIERVLGQGGFGITYLAVQVNLNRKVAIKEFFMKELCNRDATTSHVSVPSTGSATTVERFRSKFVKEAQTIAGLDNPHIIRIHDIFNENGTAYYVMDYLGNGSLSDRVKSGGPMDAQTATTYIRQIGEALTYLHARSINHLDIKPSNILINASGEAIVIDFGLSKRYDESGTQTSSTPVGISHGYAPLEQYQPGGVSTFSPTADIYALGATLFYLLTATAPPNATTLLYDGFPTATLTSHNVAPTIAIIVEKAMQPLPKDRYASVAEMTSALDKALSTKTDEATVTANTDPCEATIIGATPTVASPKPTATSPKPTATSPKTPATTTPKPTASSHNAPATKPHIQWHWKRAALVMLLEYVAVIVHTSIFSQYSWFKGLYYTFVGYESPDMLDYAFYVKDLLITALLIAALCAAIYRWRHLSLHFIARWAAVVYIPAFYPFSMVIDPFYFNGYYVNSYTAFFALSLLSAFAFALPMKLEEGSISKTLKRHKVQTLWIVLILFSMACGTAVRLQWYYSERKRFVKPVDLGLSVKWSPVGTNSTTGSLQLEGWPSYTFSNNDCSPNKDADDPTDYGEYIINEINIPTKDCDLKRIPINGNNDHPNTLLKYYGDGWRMPTYAEMKELVEKCTWDWVKIPEGYYGETYGYRVTGPSGRSILLPARGYLRLDKRNGTYYASKRREGHDAYYMTGTVNHAKPDGLYVHYLAIESNDSLGTHTAKMRSMSIEDAQHITMCIRAVHD
ncbi:MAG: serine/threonine-protein kinase [Prevotella sp.]|nr:serine/threonine-protein kinase [Prevotella sp.]